MTENELILVTGATGRQGGATARTLRQRGYRVRALTRDASKPAVETLRAQGIDTVEGDLNDPSSVRPHLAGVGGVFAALNFWEAGYDGEVRQGRDLIDIARAADVSHFVYSSVASADRHTGVPHFDSKREIERHLQTSELPYTVLRPTSFMDDWEDERDSIAQGVIALPLDPKVPLQQIAVDDIAAFATLAFERPSDWIGRSIDLAGDDIPMSQVAEVFAKATGHPVRYAQMSWEDSRNQLGEELTTMFRFFDEVGMSADIAMLRRLHPQLKTLEQYLAGGDWRHPSLGAGSKEAAS